MSRFQVTVPTAKRRFCILEKEQFNSPIAYVLCAKCYLKQVWCKLLTETYHGIFSSPHILLIFSILSLYKACFFS